MRKFILVLLLVFPLLGYCQKDANYFKGRKKEYTCDDIVKINDELKDKYQERLGKDFILSPISFSKIKTDNAQANILRFCIQYYPYSFSDKGVFFKLENGEIIKMPDVKVDVSYSSSGYSLMSGFNMDSDLIKKLKDSFIIQYSVGDKTINIEENNLRNLKKLFNCMFGDN